MTSKFMILIAVSILLLSMWGAEGKVLKPRRIKSGDTIGFISPASPVVDGSLTEENYKRDVINGMAHLGLKVQFSPNSFVKGPGGLAGTDEQRTSDLMWAFTNPNISGIIANRGGWGCNRIISMLDYNYIQQHPKVIMGFSDITGCLNAITTKTSMTTFHGPMGVNDWNNNANSEYFRKVVIDASPSTVFVSKTRTRTIVPGVAKGRLIGGNLSVFDAMAGSQYFPTFEEPYIIFFEDVTEPTYSMDRYLTQIANAGIFQRAAGLVFGQCTSCPVGGDFTIDQLLDQKWKPLGRPAFTGAMTGHIHEQFTLPIGGWVEINATAGTISLIEPAVNN